MTESQRPEGDDGPGTVLLLAENPAFAAAWTAKLAPNFRVEHAVTVPGEPAAGRVVAAPASLLAQAIAAGNGATVALVTATASIDERRALLRLGAADVLDDSVSESDLALRIARVADAARAGYEAQLLDAIAAGATLLVSGETPLAHIPEALGKIGQATSVSRVVVCRDRRDTATNLPAFTERWAWNAESAQPVVAFEGTWDAGLSAWRERLRAREVLSFVTDHAAGAEREFLADRGVRSVLLAPIHLGRYCWGFVALVEAGRPRAWSRGEQSMLHLAAVGLASAIATNAALESRTSTEASYRELVENANDTIYTTDLEGRFLTANRAAAELTGYPQHQLPGMRIEDLLTPESAAYSREMLARKIRGEDVKTQYELDLLTASGRVKPVEVNTRLIFEGGSPVGSQGIARDLSAKRAIEAADAAREQALLESEQSFRTLFSASPQPMWVSDAETLQFLEVNDRAIELYGYSRDEFLAMSITQIRPPEDLARLEEFYHEHQPGELDAGIWRHYRRDGSLISVHIHIRKLEFRGRDARLIIAEDVTDKLATERALQQAAEFNQRIITSVSDVIFTTDRDGHIEFVNPRLLESTGYSAAELIGRPFRALLPSNLEEELGLWIEDMVEGKGVVRLTAPVRRRDGSVATFDWGVAPVITEGEVVGYIASGHDVTIAREHEAEITRLAAIVESSSDAIITTDVDGLIISWNAGAEHLYGFTAAEALGRPITMLLADQDEGPNVTVERLAQGEAPAPFETPLRRKNGELVWVSVASFPVFDAEGSVIALAGISRDITEARNARIEQARLAAIVRWSSDAILSTTPDGKVTHWNDAAERILGWTRDEMLGRYLSFLVAEDHLHRTVEVAQAIMSGRALDQFEIAVKHKDGRRVLVSLSAFPILDTAGNTLSIAGIARDITAQRQAETELREREEMLDLMYRAANAGIVIVDGDGRFVRVNEQYAEIVGRPVEELIGKSFMSLIEPDSRGRVMENHSERLEGISTPARDIVIVRPNGERRTVASTAALFQRSDGDFYSVAVTHDVTEQRLAADALREREEMLALAHQAVNVGIIVADESGAVVSANEPFLGIVGRSRDDVIGRPYIQFLAAGDQSRGQELHHARMQTKDGSGGSSREWVLPRPDGTSRIVTTISGRFDRSDGRKYVVLVITDVTEQRATEGKAQQLAAILEASHDIIVSMDLSGRYMTWNRGAEEVLGWHAEEVLGKRADEIFPEITPDFLDGLIAASSSGQDVDGVEITIANRAGKLVALSVSFFAVRDGQGTTTSFGGIARDITAERETQAEVERHVQELQALYRLRVDLSEGTTVDQLLGAGADALKACLGAHRGTSRMTDESGAVRWVVSDGLPAEFLDHFTQATRSGPPQGVLAVADVASWSQPDPQVSRVFAENEIGSLLVVPLAIPGPAQAQLAACHATAHAWTGQEIELAQTIAGSVGYAISQLQMERALQESVERLSAVSRATNDAVWDWDLVRDTIWWSEGFNVVFGYSPEEVRPESEFWLSIIHPADRDRVEATIRHAIQTGDQTWSEEYRVRRRDGTYATVLDRGYLILGDDWKATRMVGSMVDISPILQAEAGLADRERFLSAIIENAPLGIQVYGPDGTSARMNEAQRRLLGLPDVTTGVGKYNALADSTPGTSERMRRALAGETVEALGMFVDFSQSREKWNMERQTAWLDQWLFPVRDHEGNIQAVVQMVSDVTERREAELARELAEQRLRAIADSLPLILFAADNRGRITFAAGRGLSLLGALQDDLLAADGTDASVIGDGLSQGIRRALLGESLADIVTISGVVFEMHLQPVIGEDGVVLGVTAVALDITERKRTEDALLQAQKLESLGVLAGGIAHDFNNLLVAILGNAGLALAELPPESPARETLEEIEIAGQRAAELARQMLAYSGKGRFVIQRIDLNTLVEEMTHLMRVTIGKATVLEYHLEPNLPAVEVDTTQIRQVVMNLVTNASDAIGEAGGTITVSTGLVHADRAYLQTMYLAPDVPEGPYLYLDVSDSGSGMDAETLARIFDPFFTTKFTGRGLGLAAVLGIVRGHKGAIRVASEPGAGTSFRLLLPAVADGAESLAPASRRSEKWTASGTVLLIEDEETVRAVTRRALELFGFDVITAANGITGIDVFRQRAPEIACVLLDLTMPLLSGEDAFAAIREIDPRARVVLMSGYSEQEAMGRFAGRGLAGFIQKPYEVEVLRAAIRAVFEQD